MADCEGNPIPHSSESAHRLMKVLVQPIIEAAVKAQQVLGGLAQHGLGGLGGRHTRFLAF